MKKYFLALYCITSLQVNAQSDTTWYDADWETVSTKDSATYYRPKPIRHTNGLYLVKDYFMSGALQSEYHAIDQEGNIMHGKSVCFYESGVKYSEFYYVKGEAHGIAKFYYHNGNLSIVEPFKSGFFHGNVIYYTEANNVSRVERYNHGKMKSGKCYSKNGEDTTYYIDRGIPRFPGGDNKYAEFIKSLPAYKDFCKKNNIKGSVYLLAKFDDKGKLTNVKIKKSLHPLADQQAIDVVKMLPDWLPKLDITGKPIPSSRTIDVYFK